MSRPIDNERLLADVLHHESDSAFGATVLAETLRRVRRQRRVRRVRRIGGTLIVLMAAVLAASHLLRRGAKPELVYAPPPQSYQLVVNQPLAAGQLVHTKPFVSDQRIVSETAVLLVQTTVGGFREVGDEELLALAAPNVVVLVRRGPHAAELVFVPSPTAESASAPN